MSTSTSTVAAAPPTFSQPADFYQTRDFGQKWEAAAQLLREHGRVFFATLLRYTAPWLLLGTVVEVAVATLPDGTPGAGFLGGIFQRVGLVVGTGITFGFIRARMNLYQTPGHQLTVADIWAATSGTGAYFGQYIISNLLTVFAMFLLVLPGIYVAVALTLLPAVFFLEDNGISRCLSLIKGHWWSTFGLALVYGLVFIGLLFVPAMVFGALVATGGADKSAAFTLPFSVLTALVFFFLNPTMNLLLAFNYFSIVETKESPGLEWRAAQLGAAPEAPAPGDDAYAPPFGGTL
ncbi:hypothetical protein GCM10027048_40730 [Hymenobacter coalescens]